MYQKILLVSAVCFMALQLGGAQEPKELTAAPSGISVKPLQACECFPYFSPICGTDNKTYPNACYLMCAASYKPGLTMAHPGPCIILSMPVKSSTAMNRMKN